MNMGAPLLAPRWFRRLALSGLWLLVGPTQAPRCQVDVRLPPLADQRILVRFKAQATGAERRSVRTAEGAQDVTRLSLIDAEIWTLRHLDARAEAARLSQRPEVLYAEPNYLWQADRVPNDPRFGEQWSLHNTGQTQGAPDADIDAPEGWDITTGQPIVIGIIDSGIDSTHVDLAERLWRNPGEIAGNGTDDDGNGYTDDIHGWDFVDWDNAPYDLHGHGTHVAGIAAATGNNGVGVAGVHWSAKLLPLRFLNADGVGANTAAIQAIEYAVRAGVPITCNSWGGAPYSQALFDAIAAACDSGMLFVAAAGNSGKNSDVSPHYPAAYPITGIVSVAATDHRDRLARELLWASNYGLRSVDLAAPGVNILSCWPNSGFVSLSGTSMAAPHVAGAAAVVWSEHRQLSAVQVKSRLMSTALPLPDLALTTVSGGRLSLSAALAEPDSLAPAAVVDLEASVVQGTRVLLRFTATGDDGTAGKAAGYWIRYATVPPELAQPDSLFEIFASAAPGPAGAAETVLVSSLRYATRYYFEVTAEDDWYNRSAPSNLLTVTTLGSPSLVASDSLPVRALAAGSDTVVQFVVANGGPGELFFETEVEFPYDRVSGPDAAAAQDTLDVLLIYADLGAVGLKTILDGFDDLGVVDVWHAGVAGGRVPRYRDLQNYDVAVAWNNRIWEDQYEIGAVLADFMDSGGAVVTLVDAWGTGAFASLGRYFQDTGYSPFVSTGDALFEVRTLGDFNALHPVMRGVSRLAIGSYHNQVRLAPGARLVASWNDGTPLVATQPHTVAINIWPGDGYHWLGDFPALIHNAIRFAAGTEFWLDVQPAQGEVAPGDSVSLRLYLDAGRLTEGAYVAYLQLATSDPGVPLMEREVSLAVSGVPRLEFESGTVEFPDPYVGFVAKTYLPIGNDGTRPLTVSAPAFDVDHFEAGFDSLVLAPGGRDSLEVTFAPAVVGEVWTNFTFITNDPIRPLVRTVLHAISSLAPAAGLSPAHLESALYSGESAVETLRLVNSGEGDLRFNTVIRGSGPPALSAADSRAPQAAAEAATDTDSLSVLAWSRYADLSPGNEFASLSTAMVETGVPILVETSSTADAGELSELLFDRNIFLVLEQENALPEITSIGTALATVLSDFVRRGGTVIFLMEWGGASGFASATGLLDIAPVARGSTVRLKKAIPDHDLLQGTSDSLVGSNLTAWYQLRTPGAQAVVTDTSGRYAVVASAEYGAGRTLLLGFDFFSYSDDMVRLLGNALRLAQRNLAWVDLSPESGVVPAGGEARLDVRFDAEALSGGDYYADVIVETNDPRQPLHTVPVQLSSQSAPHLKGPTDFDFGILYEGTEDDSLLVVENSGTLPLVVDSLGSAEAGFAWSRQGFALDPRQTRTVPVHVLPGTAGAREAWMRFFSNDPGSPVDSVRIRADIQEAPRLESAVDTVRVAAHTGARTQASLYLRNRGGSPLQVQARALYPGPAHSSANSDWSGLVPLPAGRSQAGVVSLPDGRLFVFGGLGAGRTTQNSLLVLAPGGQWEEHTPMPTGDFGMAAATDREGRIYSFSANADASYRYDPGADAWERIADPPVGRVWGAGAALGPDGRIYVIGGEGEGHFDPLGTVQVYHPEFDYWTVANDMPTPRYGLSLVAGRGGLFYAIGGRQSYIDSPLATVEIYDPVADRWQSGAPRPVAAMQMGACLGADSRIHTMGGHLGYVHQEGPFLDQVFVYDPRQDHWTEGPALPYPVGECQAVTAAGHIHLVGGTDSVLHDTHLGLPSPSWFSVPAGTMSIAAGDSLPFLLSVDATGLGADLHTAKVRLLSNDPVTPNLDVEVQLTILSASDAAVWTQDLHFTPLFVGEQERLGVRVSNLGTSRLDIIPRSTQPSVFEAVSAWSVDPGADSVFQVQFVPGAQGNFTADLELGFNDPDQANLSIPMSGWGALPGRFSVSPAELALAPGAGQDTSVTVRITNDGGGELHWRLEASIFAPSDPTAQVRSGFEPEVQAAGSNSGKRRLDGVAIGISDVRLTPAYSLISADLRSRGAHVLPFYRPVAARLDSIDVLVLDDYVTSLFAEDLDAVVAWVRRGGRLLLQNQRQTGLTEANRLVAEAGLALHRQTSGLRGYDRLEAHPATLGIDSIAAGDALLFCDWQAPATPIVKDPFGRGVVVASALGLGRVVVTCSRVLDDHVITRADTRLFGNQLLDWLAVGTPFLAEPAFGSVPAGGATELRVTTATSAVTHGHYDWNLTVLSDDPVNRQVDIPVNVEVLGMPLLDLDSDTLWFDTSYVGFGNSASVRIHNDGTAPLVITGVTVTPGTFSVKDTTYTVAEFEGLAITVACVPDAVGVAEGWLTLTSNDGQSATRTVVLRAFGLLPPKLDAPASPLAVVLAARDSGSLELTVTNTGLSDLDLSVDILPDTVMPASGRTVHRAQTVMLSGDQSPRGLGKSPLGASAETFEYQGDLMRMGVNAFGEVYPIRYPGNREQLWGAASTVVYGFDGLDVLHTNYQAVVGFTVDSLVEERADLEWVVVVSHGHTEDGRLAVRRTFSFDRKRKAVAVDTRFTNLAELPLVDVVYKALSDWDIDASPINDNWDYDSLRQMPYGWDQRYAGLASRERPAVIDIEGRTDAYRRYTFVDHPSGPVYGVDAMPILHFDLGDLAPGASGEVRTVFAVGDSLADLKYEIDRALKRVPWLDTHIRSALLKPDSSVVVQLSVTASDLVAGEYRARLRISSNDPVTPQREWPVLLTVTGAPTLVMDRDTIDFGAVYIGYTSRHQVAVANSGTDVLHISGVTTGHDAVTASWRSLTLPPGTDSSLELSITPVDTGAVEGLLTLVHDDTLQQAIEIPMRAHAAWPPVLEVDTATLQVTVGSGSRAYVPFQLANRGPGFLHWSFLPQPVITASPPFGLVAPQTSALITLVVSAATLPPGQAVATLVLSHNDPARPPVDLTFTLDVFAVRRGDAYTDNRVDVRDIIYLVNTIWKGGPDPVGSSGDLDCDRAVTMSDLMLLINYVFKSGPAPDCQP